MCVSSRKGAQIKVHFMFLLNVWVNFLQLPYLLRSSHMYLQCLHNLHSVISSSKPPKCLYFDCSDLDPQESAFVHFVHYFNFGSKERLAAWSFLSFFCYAQ